MRALFASVIAVAILVTAASAQSVTVRAGKPKTLTLASIAAAEKGAAGTFIGGDRKSLIVKGKSARLVVRTGPDNDMMSYRIMGLRNPTITVPAGATLRILFINSDVDMLHNLRFTAKQAPFDSKLDGRDSTGSANLPHVMATSQYSQELTVTAPAKSGTYTYICTIPGHAAAGMFGTLIVR